MLVEMLWSRRKTLGDGRTVELTVSRREASGALVVGASLEGGAGWNSLYDAVAHYETGNEPADEADPATRAEKVALMHEALDARGSLEPALPLTAAEAVELVAVLLEWLGPSDELARSVRFRAAAMAAGVIRLGGNG
jgi:hypothetical protein